MGWLYPWLLFAHVLGAVLAFGPTYAYGTYAGLAAQEGGAARSFNDKARTLVNKRMVMPGTYVVLVSGVLMIWALNYPWTSQSARWLQLSIVLFVGMAFMLYALDLALTSDEGLAQARALIAMPIGAFVTWGLLTALAYHFVAGVKHFFMDFGHGETLKGGRMMAQGSIAIAVVLSVLAGVWVW